MTTFSIRVRWPGGDRTFAPGDTASIGRDPSSTIRLSDERVSRRHAQLRSGAEGWVIEDLGSTSGTYIGGERVRQLVVSTRTSIRFGASTDGELIEFELVPSDSVSAGPAPTEIVAPPVLQPTIVPSSPPVRPGGALAPDAAAGATEVVGNTLNVQFAGRTTVLAPGQEARLGRDTSVELTTDNPTVSRQHARLVFADGAWWLEDLDSTRGTFLDGRRVTRQRIQGSMAFWLGAVDAGERLVLVASGDTQRSVASRMRNPRTVALLAGTACVVALIALAVVLLGGEEPKPANVEAQLRRSAVRLQMSYGSGTGSVIDAERGLILTNAHVAAPNAPGLGVRYPDEAFRMPEPDDEILISIADASDAPAEPTYYGEVVAADGYLDLAVVKITRTIGGRLVEEGEDLGLTEIPIGDSRTIDQDSDLIIMGYPGIAETAAPTKSKGSVSSFVSDERIGDNRAWLNSDAAIDGGNSGGIAADERGRLIAVPTAELGVGSGNISKLRPVHLAEDLIEKAKEGDDYESPFVVPASAERIEGDPSFAADGEAFSTSCDGRVVDGLSSAGAVSLAFDFIGFPEGHQDMLVTVFSNGEWAGASSSADWYPVDWGESGCATVTVRLQREIAQGDEVTVWVDVGPNFEREILDVSFTA